MLKINKAKARRLYNEGKTIHINSCKVAPDSFWQKAIPLNKDEEELIIGLGGFDNRVNEFEYYNCDYERGYYASYYIRQKEA